MDDFSTAPYDTACRVVTSLVFAMTAFFIFLFFRIDDFPPYAMALMPAVLLITWGFSVRGYSIEHGRLVVQRPFLSRSIALGKDIAAVHDPEAAKGAVRIAGNGGLFGYYGSFRSKKLGLFTAFATDWKFGVVVRTGGKTFVVTPEDPEMFISRLTESAGQEWGT